MSSYGYPSGTPARAVRPRAPIAPRPDNRAGPLGADPAPFPSLAAKPQTTPAPSSFTQDAITRSLAANPQAAGGHGSTFAYQGQQGPMPAQYIAAPVNPAPVAPVAPNVAYDYNADQILQQAHALSGRNRGDAQSGALAAKKQLAIDFNDTALANQLGDPATAQAAQGNQFGVLEQLKHSYDQGAHNLDEQLNNQNLFYGGHRIQEQGNLAHDYQGQLAGAAGQEQGLLGGIGDQLAAALSTADANDIAASQSAADRAAQFAITNGIDPGAAAPAPPGGPPTDPYAAPSADALAAPQDIASLLFPTGNTPLVDPSAVHDPLAAALAGTTRQRKLALNPLLG